MTRRVLGREKVKEGKAKIPLKVDEPDYANGEYPLNVKYLENEYYEGSDAFGKLLHVYKTFIHCPTIYVYKGIDKIARLTANLYSNNNLLNEGKGSFFVENVPVNQDSLVHNGSTYYDYSLEKYEETNDSFVPYGFEYYGVNENYREPVKFDNARIVFVELKRNFMPVSIKTYPVMGAKGETVKLVCRVYNRIYGEVINTPIDIPRNGYLKWYVNGRYIKQSEFYENGYAYINYKIIEDIGVYEYWVEYVPAEEEHYNKGYGANTLAVLPKPTRITASANIPTGQLGQTCTFNIQLSRIDCINGLRLYIDDHLIHLTGTTAENNYTLPVTSKNMEVSFNIPNIATSNNMWATSGTHMVFWEYDDTCTGVTHYQPLNTLLIGFSSIIDFDYIGRNIENPYSLLDFSQTIFWIPYLRDAATQDQDSVYNTTKILPVYDSTENYLQMGKHYFYYNTQYTFNSSTRNKKIIFDVTIDVPSAYSMFGLLFERNNKEPAFNADERFDTTQYPVESGKHIIIFEVDENGVWTKTIDGTIMSTFTLNDTDKYIGFYTGTANNLYIHDVCIKDMSKNYDTILYNKQTGIPIVTPEILGHISNKEYPTKIADDGLLTLDIEKLLTHVTQHIALERTAPICNESQYEVDDYANITSALYSNKDIVIPSRTIQLIHTTPDSTQTINKTTTINPTTHKTLLNKAGTWKIQTKYPGNKYEYDCQSNTKTINVFKKDTTLTLSQDKNTICLNDTVTYTAILKCKDTPLQNEIIKITIGTTEYSKQTNNEGKITISHQHTTTGNIQTKASFEETYKYNTNLKTVTTKVKTPVTITIRPSIIYDYPSTTEPHINIQVKDYLGNKINEGTVDISFEHINTGITSKVGTFDLSLVGSSFNLIRDNIKINELYDAMLRENSLFYTGYTLVAEYKGTNNYCTCTATARPVGIRPKYSSIDVELMMTNNPNLDYYNEWRQNGGLIFDVNHEEQTLTVNGAIVDMDEAGLMGRVHAGDYIYVSTKFLAQHIFDNTNEPQQVLVGGIKYDINISKNEGPEQPIANVILNGGTSTNNGPLWARIPVPTNMVSGDSFTVIFYLAKNNAYYNMYDDKYGLKYQFKFEVEG